MKLTILCLLVVCVAMMFMVDDSSAWWRSRRRTVRRIVRAGRKVGDFARRIRWRRLSPFKRSNTDDEGCDPACFAELMGETDLTEAELQELFNDLDTDNDGSLSDEELAAMEEDEPEKRELKKQELMEELDALLKENKDDEK